MARPSRWSAARRSRGSKAMSKSESFRRHPERFLNRELSWLAFNERVLAEAQDAGNPPLERLKFLAITASNLDEFFMVRVGSLQALAARGGRGNDPAGLTPRQQLAEIARRAHEFVRAQHACYAESIAPALAAAGIRPVRMDELNEAESRHLARLFDEELYPLLTPMAVEEGDPFPTLPGLTLHLAVRLRRAAEPGGGEALGLVGLPRSASRFYAVPGREGYAYIAAEDLMEAFAERLFPGYEILEAAGFRITRNADMSVREDLAGDLLAQMKEVLVERRLSDVLRLELRAPLSAAFQRQLERRLEVRPEEVYAARGPLDFSGFFAIAGMSGFDELKIEPWTPCPSPDVPAAGSIFDAIARRDILLFHPYESFDPVLRFVKEAASDPKTLAIKMILYRTSRNSPVVAALRRAAANGKLVTALVELKARFDEARNIEWAEELERAGVQVIYGVKRLKTHAKICLVVRREPAGIRRYMHFGTGNYNEQTARIYSDVGWFTAREDYGADASAFFNMITGRTQPARLQRLSAAPLGLRPRLLELIRGETQRALAGQKARILAKVNSLADPEIIEALYEASRAGVKIELSVRGICCLRPGVPGVSDHITVSSVLDRYLEHARIFCFHQGGEEAVFISSADWMPRNLDRRVELLIPVADARCAARLKRILRVCLDDTAQAWRLRADGRYERRRDVEKPKKPLRSQWEFQREAERAARRARAADRGLLEPHIPPRSAGGPPR